MDVDNAVLAGLALTRFGLGATGAGVDPIISDPIGALREEITERFVPTPVGPALKPTGELLVDLVAFQAARAAERNSTPPGTPSSPMMATANADASTQPMDKTMQPPSTPPTPPPAAGANSVPYMPESVLRSEADARLNGTIHQPLIGFGERLAMFWANHFAVSASKGENLRILAGAFEREAIRPYVFGRFADMLQAVETHPAMLFFLDNAQSVGPASNAAKHGQRGLNENLAREILELHTLGVGAGYTQADVTAFARTLTGWTVTRKPSEKGPAGSFVFSAYGHEPGDQTILGLTYQDEGIRQGRAVLTDLARHPATAVHITGKLARHFVADNPSADLLQHLAATYTKTDGDLTAVYLAMIDSEECWSPVRPKLRTPLEFLVACLRATDARPKPAVLLNALAAMGQPLWSPPGPNGFPDTVDALASSEALSTRLELAGILAQSQTPAVDPRVFAQACLGALLTPQTQEAVAHAETRAQGLSIVLLSPEFQRR